MFFVRSKGDTEATRAEILKLNPQNRIRSMSEYVSLMNSSNLPELKPFIRTMVGLGVVVSFLVVLMNMHTMILERTREIRFEGAGIFAIRCGENAAGRDNGGDYVGGQPGGDCDYVYCAGILKETNPGLSDIADAWMDGGVDWAGVAGSGARGDGAGAESVRV